MNFEGRTVIITGAASGIGKAAAELFASEGADLVLVDIDAGELNNVAVSLCSPGRKIATLAGDVGSEETAGRVAKAAESPDVLVNSAGIDLDVSLLETSVDQWDRVMDVNLKSIFLMCRSVVPLMTVSGASIINISSAAGLSPIANRPAYIASKGAIVALTRALALDLAPAIRVNCVCPGAVKTPLLQSSAAYRESPVRVKARYPLARIAEAREVACLIAFLASDAAANITGAAIPVDGGRSMA